MKKINSLEGLRTIGCISVFLCHFRLAFLPDRTFWLIDNTPLRILTDGTTVVKVLFVLSGFAVSYKYFTGKKYEEVPGDIVKRYFRLAPPVILANVAVYLLMRAGLLYNVRAAHAVDSEFLGSFNNFIPNLGECLKEAFMGCYLRGANKYVGPLWTITYEYLGVILILCAIYLCKDSILLRSLFYFVVLTGFMSDYNYFVIGMFLCDIYSAQNRKEGKRRHKGSNMVLIAAGVYLVCMFQVDYGMKLSRVLFAAGIVMLFLGILNSNRGDRILGNRVMQAGGRLSYGIYIVHWPIIESFSCAYYLGLTEAGVSRHIVLVTCLPLTLLLVLAVAYLFCRYVEKPGEIAASYIRKQL